MVGLVGGWIGVRAGLVGFVGLVGMAGMVGGWWLVLVGLVVVVGGWLVVVGLSPSRVTVV